VDATCVTLRVQQGKHMTATDIAHLDREFRVEDQIRVVERERHGVVAIRTERCTCEIALQGAHVLSWRPSGHEDLLWSAALPPAGTGRAIRGGIPICWPWFGPHANDPTQPQHGLVRTRPWQLVATSVSESEARAALEIATGEGHLRLDVVAGASLQLVLATTNMGAAPFAITEALHTYFKVGDAAHAQVLGLDGCRYRDNTDGGREKTWQGPCVMDRETIAVFETSPDEALIEDPVLGRRIRIRRMGGHSTVAWNPGDNIAPLKDVPAGEQRHFICVESGNVWSSGVTIAPGGAHRLGVRYDMEMI